MRVVLPIKDLQQCKSRLAPRLDARARAALMAALAGDILRACQHSPLVDASYVISHDPAVQQLASNYGAQVLDLAGDRCLNSAVGAALAQLPASDQPTLILHADIPALTASDLEQLLLQHLASGAALSLVPDADNNGTNAIILNSGVDFDFHYGDHSFDKHQQRARQLGLDCHTLTLPAFACDIDLQDDLHRLAQQTLTADSALCQWRRQYLLAADLTTTNPDILHAIN